MRASGEFQVNPASLFFCLILLLLNIAVTLDRLLGVHQLHDGGLCNDRVQCQGLDQVGSL